MRYNYIYCKFTLHQQYGSPVSTISNFSVGSTLDDFKDDPFKSKDAFGGDSSGGGSDPFQNEDPFKEGRLFKLSTLLHCH